MKTMIFFTLWLGAMGAGVALGVWQLDRLQMKERQLANIDVAYRIADDKPLVPAELRPPYADMATFYRGQVRGVVRPETAFLVSPRIYQGQIGAHLYVALQTDVGPMVWVNAGFVRDDYVPNHLRPRQVTSMMASMRPATLEGVARPMIVSGIGRFVWGQAVALRAETLATGTVGVPLVMYPENEVNVMEDNQVTPLTTVRPTPPNNHLAYAIFWFGMSLVAGIFGGYTLAQGSGFARARNIDA